MSSITQMGIINIENDSLSKISPVKRDSVQMNNKIIEEVSEENQSQSATSVKKQKKVGKLETKSIKMKEEMQRLQKIGSLSSFQNSEFALDTIFQHVQNTQIAK